MGMFEFKKIAFEAFKKAMADNELEIQSLAETWHKHIIFARNGRMLNDVLVDTKIGEDTVIKISQDYKINDPKLEEEQATFVGTGLFYSYKLGITIECLLLMLADHLFEKYDFPYEYQVDLQLGSLLGKNSSKVPFLELVAANAGEQHIVNITSEDLDMDRLKEDANNIFLTKLQTLDVNLKMDNLDTIPFAELSKWFKKFIATLQKINEA